MWFSGGLASPRVNLRMSSRRGLHLVWLLGYLVSRWVYFGRAQPLKLLSNSKHQSKTVRSQVSVLSSCHFPLTDSQGSVFCLTSIKTQALAPSPRCPFRSLQFTTTQSQSKLEEERIKMGNLPVIPCTMAKGAICLINSHLCRSAVWPSSISPSIRPPMRPWRVRDERLREGA